MFDERAAAARIAAETGIHGRMRAPDWQRTTRRPRVQLPRGACDSHIHVIGPQHFFPLLPGPYNFLDHEDSTVDDWMRVRDTLGLSRGIHVQSFMYGHGYHFVLHTLLKASGSLRGVVGMWPGVTDGELSLLEGAGVIGARFAPSIHPEIDERLIDRLVERDWSIHYSLNPETDSEWRKGILRRRGRFVLEHIGLAPGSGGVSSSEFDFVLRCLDTGRCWVKLSARGSDDTELPFSDLRPMVESVLDRAPNRALWGSDWPHVPYFRPMPNDADLIDLAGVWIGDPGLLRKVFVDNPAEVFDWPIEDAAARSRGGRADT